MNVTVAEAAALLKKADDILILSHRRPDGDTSGCAGALCRGLQQLGKNAYVLQNPEITKRYAGLIVPCYPPAGFQANMLVTVDVADTNMLTGNAEAWAEQIDLVIDHHRSNPGFGASNLIRPTAGGCGKSSMMCSWRWGCSLLRILRGASMSRFLPTRAASNFLTLCRIPCALQQPVWRRAWMAVRSIARCLR